MRVFKDIKAVSSNLYWTKRINIYWGHWSQIKAELLVLEAACNNGPYKYYHIISGVDYPLNTQDYIHSFCNDKDCEFVGFSSLSEEVRQQIEYRTSLYHFFIRYKRCRSKKIRRTAEYLHDKCILLQKRFHIGRKYILSGQSYASSYMQVEEIERPVMRKGPNWCSLTEGFVQYLLQHKKTILKQFRWTYCSDEIFLQTVLWNSPFKERIYAHTSGNEHQMNMREIDWTRGEPYVWKTEDAPYLLQSDRFFARKFSSSDFGILHILQKKVNAGI